MTEPGPQPQPAQPEPPQASAPNPSRWARFAEGAQRDLKLWLVFMGLLSLCRLGLIVAFRERMASGTGAGAVLLALLNGLRFDSQVAVVWLAPSLLFGVVAAFIGWGRAASVVRQVLAGLFIFVTVLLAVITYGYFREYGNQFDEWIFGVVEDDFGAILATVWKEYPATTVAVVMLVFDAGLFLGVRWLVRKPWVGGPRLEALRIPWRSALTGLLVLFLVVAARGSLGRRPVQDKDAAVTADDFLNKTVVNSYRALERTISVRRRLNKSSRGIGVYLPDGDIRAAAERVFGQERVRSAGGNLDACLLRTAAGARQPPRHIFLVVDESYSAWPLDERYRSLGLAGEVERLGREGVLLTRFLPASSGTMTSLATILTGIMEHGAPICYQPNSRRPYPTSLAAIFERLGYRTRFFYGGYLSWQRMGDFARDQGFAEVYGGGDIGGRIGGNEWGAPDAALFDFVRGKVADDRPSLNLILTVSNHPPFDVDVGREGFPLEAVPAELAPLWNGEFTLKQLGHFWYADRCLGRFIDAIEKKLPGVLVVATADHYGRRFLNSKPDLAERSFVPLLLHGPDVLGVAKLPEGACGSHLDIPATLVELAAPAGFSYAAMGRSVFSPEAVGPAFGSGRVVGPGYLAELKGTFEWVALPGAPGGSASVVPDRAVLKRRENDLKAVGWWRVLRGPELPDAAEPGGAPARPSRKR